MDELTMWSLIVGFASPLLIAVVQQPKWSNATRAVVTALIAVLLGLGTAYFNDMFSGQDIVGSVLVVLVSAITTYKGLWHPVGLAPAIENATSAGGASRGTTSPT